jgi:hypothetical protein
MSQINRPPQGLQFLLGSQNFGVNPNELITTIQPTVDVSDMLASQLVRSASGSGSRVDEGEVCAIEFFDTVRLLAVSAYTSAALASNEIIDVSFALTQISGDQPDRRKILWSSNQQLTWNAGGVPAYGFTLPEPMTLPAGSKLSFWFDYAVTPGAGSWYLEALYQQLSVQPT